MHLLICCLLLAAAATAHAQAPPADSLTYDVIAQLPRHDQIRLFNQATPEQQAAIAREQPVRWLATNREALSPEQVAFVEEMIAYIQPARYGAAASEAQEAELIAFQERALALLSQEQFFRAFIAGAPYIPKP